MKSRLIALLALTLLAGSQVLAAEGGIGKLDAERVFKEYKLYQKHAEELQAMGRQLLRDVEERRRRHPLLLDEEWKRYTELRDKGANMTPGERTEFEDLSQRSNNRDKQLAELEGLAKLDEKQKKTWQELSGMRSQAKQQIDDQWEKVRQTGADRMQEIEADLTKKIEDAVKKVMEAKGLAIVVQADVVVVGGTDITDATLELLNADQPANGTAPAPANP